MDSSEHSKSTNRDGMPGGKTGEGSSSALNEMVKRAPRQPEPCQPHAPGSDKAGDAQHDKGPSAN